MISKALQISFILVAILFLSSESSQSQEILVSNKGYLNLSDWGFKEQGIIQLDGEWEIYPQQLLEPGDFNSSSLKLRYIDVPGYWNNLIVDNKPFGGSGFATYRLRVKLKPQASNLALRIYSISTSAKIFVNNRLIKEIGKVGKGPESSQPKFSPQVIPIPSVKDSLELVIQVSNFDYSEGGIWHSIELGRSDSLTQARDTDIRIETFFMGSFITIGFYYLGVYFRRRKGNEPSLFFALYCFTMTIRFMSIGEVFNKSLDWYWLVYLEYFGFLMSPIMFISFIWSLFPVELSKNIQWFLIGLYTVLLGICSFTSPVFYTSLVPLIQILIIIPLFYIIYGIILANIRKRSGARWVLFALIITFIAVLIDMLVARGYVQFINTLPISLFILTLIQAYILAGRFFKILDNNEVLSVKLKNTNQNLENLVEERTSKLKSLNQELILREDEVLEQSKKTEKLYYKLSQSIKAAQHIQKAIFPRDDKLKQVLGDYFLFYRPKDVVSGDFYWLEKVENKIILGVFDCTGHGVPGAFMTLIGYETLNNIILEQGVHDPASILNKLNTQVRKKLKQKEMGTNEGMDASVLLIEELASKQMKVTFSGAKHSIYYARQSSKNSESIERLRGNRTGIAGNQIADTEFQNHIIRLQKGDIVYAGTDGLEDQNNSKRKKFGRNKFINVLSKMSHLALEEQHRLLSESFDEFKMDTSQRDDILWLGLRL